MLFLDYFINVKIFLPKSRILPCSSQQTSVRSTDKTAKRLQLTQRSTSRLIFASLHRDANCAQMERFSALGGKCNTPRDYLEGKNNSSTGWSEIIRKPCVFVIYRLELSDSVIILRTLKKHHWCPKIASKPLPDCWNSDSTEALGTKSSEIMLETFHLIINLPLHQKFFPDSPCTTAFLGWTSTMKM